MTPETKKDIETIGDVPDSYRLLDGRHQCDIVLEMIGEDPEDWSHGGLFVDTHEGDYTDVLFFPGCKPTIHKPVTRIL